MNKYIKLVKKGLDDLESVSLEELETARNDAWDEWWDVYEGKDLIKENILWAVYEAVEAVNAAIKDHDYAYYKQAAIRHVKEYEELTKEQGE